jgi:glycosyltransferase involved in cell wall biosynthesis
LRADLERAIAEGGLEDCVELLGFISEEQLVCAYQAANVTVVPSQLLEGFGTIISESLACGTPVIATPVGGIPEALAPLDGRLLARTAHAADIAERMRAVIDRTSALPNAERCREYAVARFDWATVTQAVRAVFSR